MLVLNIKQALYCNSILEAAQQYGSYPDVIVIINITLIINIIVPTTVDK